MTYLVVLGSFAFLLRASHVVRERRFVALLIAGGLACFAALRADDVSSDFTIYQDWYRMGIDADGLLERPPILEAGFFAGMALFHGLGVPFRGFLFGVAIAAIALKFNSLQRIATSGNALLAGACCYLFSDFLLHDFTQLRAGLAIGSFMLSLVYLHERRTRAFLIAIAVGALFHSSALLGLIAWPLARWRSARTDAALLLLMIGAAASRAAGYSVMARLAETVGGLDARLGLYVQLADSGVTEAADPLSVRVALVWLLIFTSYATLAHVRTAQTTAVRIDSSDLDSMRTLLRLLVLGQFALFAFADVQEIAVRTMEFWMASLPLYMVLVSQHRSFRLPAAIVWLWLLATFINFVFRTPALVAPYAIGI